ncbi:MAG TPA: VCBS repeat-containing protein [Kofleriaceae bacterium]|nr:VCBS repeat-containing protein [Kofleriaceae bacterium]
MTVKVFLTIGLGLPLACGPGGDEVESAQQPAIGSNSDPDPSIAFTQVGRTVGIDRSREPPSAGVFHPTGTLAYGSWLADLDGDGRLDYFAVNHSQTPHLSGLFINNGAGGFGKNLFTVSFQPSTVSFPNLDLSNEMRFVGDLTGDGLVDFYFVSWSGFGVMCVNRGVAQHADWTGPSYLCFGTTDGVAFADVNGDGKIDVLQLDATNFDVYTAYYSQTAPYVWRLNNGTPNIQTWPTTTSFLALRVTDPSAAAAPFVDLNNDGIPDKIVGIVLPPARRGPHSTSTGGQQVFLGQANGTYVLKTATGLEAATAPITRIEDVNDDGCLDIGTDITAYRDNQTWYLQNKTGATCNVTFTATPRTALPYYPGYKRYSVDIDNSGLLSKVVIIHNGYGSNNGRPGGVSIYRTLPNGSYSVITPTQSGINIDGTAPSEFYADNLSPGDWNDDGRLDLGGTGSDTIPNADTGFALWTSALATTNSWIKVTLPSVTGFFTGTATIELFDAGFVGDATHLVTPPKVLYTGKAWASQVYHFGIGTRSSVDVRVTFPDGRQIVRAGVAPASRIAIQPTPH